LYNAVREGVWCWRRELCVVEYCNEGGRRHGYKGSE
jgi:hypothetical protein